MTEAQAYAKLLEGHASAGISVEKAKAGYQVTVAGSKPLGPYSTEDKANQAALKAYLKRLAKAVVA